MKYMFERRLLGGIPENIGSCEGPSPEGSCPFGQVVSRDSISEKPPVGVFCVGPRLDHYSRVLRQ